MTKVKSIFFKIMKWSLISAFLFVAFVVLVQVWMHRDHHAMEAKSMLRVVHGRVYGGEHYFDQLPPSFSKPCHRPRIYWREEDLPPSLKALLLPSEIPYVKDKKFRIIALGARGSRSALFMTDENSKVADIYEREVEYDLSREVGCK